MNFEFNLSGLNEENRKLRKENEELRSKAMVQARTAKGVLVAKYEKLKSDYLETEKLLYKYYDESLQFFCDKKDLEEELECCKYDVERINEEVEMLKKQNKRLLEKNIEIEADNETHVEMMKVMKEMLLEAKND